MPRNKNNSIDKEWREKYGHCKSLQDVVIAALKKKNYSATTKAEKLLKWPEVRKMGNDATRGKGK